MYKRSVHTIEHCNCAFVLYFSLADKSCHRCERGRFLGGLNGGIPCSQLFLLVNMIQQKVNKNV